jgi:hypothetical protein
MRPTVGVDTNVKDSPGGQLENHLICKLGAKFENHVIFKFGVIEV